MNILQNAGGRPPAPDSDAAVDFRGLESRSAEGDRRVAARNRIEQNVERPAEAVPIVPEGDPGLELHEPGPALLLDPLWNGVPELEGRRPFLPGIGEDSEMVEGGPAHEILQPLELGRPLSGEPDDDRGAQSGFRQSGSYPVDETKGTATVRSPAHQAEDLPVRVLEGNIEVRTDLWLLHGLEKRSADLLRIAVEESDPGYPADPKKLLEEAGQPVAKALVAAVGGRILGDQVDLFDAFPAQLPRFGDDG